MSHVLRRGFIQTGAVNLLMTLWPISDELTVQIMIDFYEAAQDQPAVRAADGCARMVDKPAATLLHLGTA